ncbi:MULTISPECIES: methyltransferase family protein [unclassified Vibrio]|uniref:methyltransferase family protein n=1 Tax=unclassified Vibrio TaxID=2614977 RepID=UPI0019299D5D|nr:MULTISPECIES: isoprenylcysteine carboxylmethyltransferase family protein [unclassified Vibrio]
MSIHKLELRIPPVALFIVWLILMERFASVMTFASVSLPFTWLVATICVVLAGYVGLAGIHEFRKMQTTVNPVKPESASRVVDSGIFAYSRNPMYLGLVILLFGAGYWLENTVALVMPYFFILYMNRFQIGPEERVLGRLFGEEYKSYLSRVRRWI